jgi:predicted dehydrogenase
MQTQIDLVILGCGRITKHTHAPLLAARLPQGSIGFFDLDATKADAMAQQFRGVAFTSVQDALASQPKIVVVATWPQSHVPLAEAALTAGVKILVVEKPLGVSVAEAARLLTRADAEKAVVMQPLHQVLALESVLRVVTAGGIGELRGLEYVWTRQPVRSRDVVDDLFPHAAAILDLAFASDPEWVVSKQVNELSITTVSYPNAIATVRLEQGATVPREEEVTVTFVGTGGRITVGLETRHTGPAAPPLQMSPGVVIGPVPGVVLGIDAARARQADVIVRALAGGPPLPISGSRCLRVQRLLNGALASRSVAGQQTSLQP